MLILRCLRRSKGSVRLRGCPVAFFLILSSYDGQLLPPLSTAHDGGPPFSECPRLLFQNIRSYPPYCRPSPLSATGGFAMSCWQGPTYHAV